MVARHTKNAIFGRKFLQNLHIIFALTECTVNNIISRNTRIGITIRTDLYIIKGIIICIINTIRLATIGAICIGGTRAVKI